MTPRERRDRGDPRTAKPLGDASDERAPRVRGRSKRRGAGRTVLHAIRQIPAYLRLLVGLLFDSRVAPIDKLLVVGAIVYVISPIDLIPDVIPFFGEIDDLFVLTLALQHLVAHADEEVLLDHWAGDPEELSDLNVGRIMAAAAVFLPSPIRAALRRRVMQGAASALERRRRRRAERRARGSGAGPVPARD